MPVGQQGTVQILLGNSFPIVRVEVRLNEQVAGVLFGDVAQTDLRAVRAMAFSVPRMPGPYDLVLAARDSVGCEMTTTITRTLTVVP